MDEGRSGSGMGAGRYIRATYTSGGYSTALDKVSSSLGAHLESGDQYKEQLTSHELH